MRDQVTALQDLLEKVEAGATGKEIGQYMVFRAFPEEFKEHLFTISDLIKLALDPEDMRAMGAAKALHEAVLPGWGWEIEETVEGNRAVVREPVLDDRTCKPCGLSFSTAVFDDGVSRAWLIAVIKALIATSA